MLSGILAALLLAPAADNPPPPIGMVLTVQGAVVVEREKDKPRPLRRMDLLYVGDRLSAGDGAEALLVILKDGHQEQLRAKAQVGVNESGCEPAEQVTRRAPRLSASNLTSVRGLVRGGRAAVGVPRGTPPPAPQIVTPLFGSTVIDSPVQLTWLSEKGARKYRVKMSSGGGEIAWTEETSATTLPWPEKQKAPKPGAKYLWTVVAYLDGGQEKTVVDSKFLLATEGERQQLAALQALAESKDSADHLLAAVTYEAHGVYDRALRLYAGLAEGTAEEGNVNVLVALWHYYRRAGRDDEAHKAAERARKLGWVEPIP